MVEVFDRPGRRGRGGFGGRRQGGGYAQEGGPLDRPKDSIPRPNWGLNDGNRGFHGRPFEDRFNYQPDFQDMQQQQEWNDWQEARPVRSPETVEWAASRPARSEGKEARNEWFSSQPDVAEGQRAAISQWIQENPLAAQMAMRQLQRRRG